MVTPMLVWPKGFSNSAALRQRGSYALTTPGSRSRLRNWIKRQFVVIIVHTSVGDEILQGTQVAATGTHGQESRLSRLTGDRMAAKDGVLCLS